MRGAKAAFQGIIRRSWNSSMAGHSLLAPRFWQSKLLYTLPSNRSLSVPKTGLHFFTWMKLRRVTSNALLALLLSCHAQWAASLAMAVLRRAGERGSQGRRCTTRSRRSPAWPEAAAPCLPSVDGWKAEAVSEPFPCSSPLPPCPLSSFDVPVYLRVPPYLLTPLYLPVPGRCWVGHPVHHRSCCGREGVLLIACREGDGVQGALPRVPEEVWRTAAWPRRSWPLRRPQAACSR